MSVDYEKLTGSRILIEADLKPVAGTASNRPDFPTLARPPMKPRTVTAAPSPRSCPIRSINGQST